MAARGPRALSSTDNTKTASRRISGEAAQASLLEAARELFYQEGVRAVGVEAVVERAGVNKMSLYRQFKSKDDLVLAYLARSAENFWGYFNASMDAHPADARAQLLQFFIDLSGRASQAGYRGVRSSTWRRSFATRRIPRGSLSSATSRSCWRACASAPRPPAPSIRTRSPTIWPS